MNVKNIIFDEDDTPLIFFNGLLPRDGRKTFTILQKRKMGNLDSVLRELENMFEER